MPALTSPYAYRILIGYVKETTQWLDYYFNTLV
jgi:hypothetical protein